LHEVGEERLSFPCVNMKDEAGLLKKYPARD